MRISDWSSDVCSSDLGEQFARSPVVRPARPRRDRNARGSHIGARRLFTLGPRPKPWRCTGDFAGDVAGGRSEEHTSELQSLMRNSYAVFCLKKKTKPPTKTSQADHI